MALYSKLLGIVGTSFAIGVTGVAASGAVRVANNVSALSARNAAGSGDLSLIGSDGSNNVTVGDVNAASILFGPASIGWATGIAAPTITQATAASGVVPNALHLAPQAPNASSATTASCTAGSLLFDLSLPVSTGNEAGVLVTRGGNIIFGVSSTNGNTAASTSLYLNAYNLALSPSTFTGGGNWFCQSNGSGIYFSTPTTGQAVWFRGGGNATYSRLGTNAAGVQISANETFSLGGGTIVVGVSNATTDPSTNPSGGSIWWSSLTVGASKQRTSSGWTKTTCGNTATTVNTQLLKYDELIATGQITSAGGTLTLNVPVTTSGSGVLINCEVLAKVTSAGTVTVVGDTFANRQVVAYKNVAGSVVIVGSAATILNASDTHLSTSTVAFSGSGTNVVITLTLNPTSGTQPGADCTILARCFYN